MDLALLDLPARSIDELLDLLAATSELRREQPDGVVPTVTLHLRSGAALTGSVIKHVAQRGGSKVVVLRQTATLDPRGDTRDEDHVSYLPAEVIEGLTVHHLLRYTVRGGVFRRAEPAVG